MKFSLGQMIAIVCILSVGFMTAAPFVQTADAHDDSHSYTLTVDALELGICACGNMAYRVVGTATITLTHGDGGSHIDPDDIIGVVVSIVSRTCSSCSGSSS